MKSETPDPATLPFDSSELGFSLLFPAGSLLASLLLVLSISGCGSHKTASEKAEPKVPSIVDAEVMAVEQQNWPMIVQSQGSLFPDEEATLGIKVEGRVIALHADIGDVVNAGDPLLSVYQADFQLQVEQAKAQLSQARSAVGMMPGDLVDNLQPVNAPPVQEQRALWDEATSNLKRAKELFNRGAIVESEYEQISSAEQVAAARYESALNSVREKIALIRVRQAELDLAQEKLEDTILKAPFKAMVQRRYVAQGSYVKIGDPLMILVRIDRLRYRGTVPERLSQLVQPGQEASLQIESVAEPRVVQISRISPSLDQLSRALLFEADVENPQMELRAGLFAEASVVVDPEATATVIPLSAVVQFAGAEKVWKVVEGKVTEQEVLLGERRDGWVQILQGLNPGEIILREAKQGRVGQLATAKGTHKQKKSSEV